MSFNNTKIKSQSERGFTIVELLIVIVVIGILAAITIVSFNGVTARANTTSAQAVASSVVKKAEAYNAEKAGYPATLSLLTATADSGTSYYIPAGNVNKASAALTAAPTGDTANKTIAYYICGNSGSTTAATAANIVAAAGNLTGIRADYWNFSTGAAVSLSTGNTTAAGGPTSNWPIGCFAV